MWREIRDKAKFNLLNLYYYLARDKVLLLNSNSASNFSQQLFYIEQPTPEIIGNRLKCINDLYLENGFI